MGLPGSQRTVQQLVDQFYQPLFRYAYRLSGSSGEAEDLTQETFCTAQAKWSQLRDPTRAKPWLFSILRNTYLKRLRDRRVEATVSLDGISDLPAPPGDPLPEIDPERLQQALGTLPEHFRTPVILFYFEDFSYRDIAEQMELPIGTVMSRLARAKSQLRSQLTPTAGNLPPADARRPVDEL